MFTSGERAEHNRDKIFRTGFLERHCYQSRGKINLVSAASNWFESTFSQGIISLRRPCKLKPMEPREVLESWKSHLENLLKGCRLIAATARNPIFFEISGGPPAETTSFFKNMILPVIPLI